MIDRSEPRQRRKTPASNDDARTFLRAVLPYVILIGAIYGVASYLQKRQNDRYMSFSRRNADTRTFAMLGSPLGGRGGRGGRGNEPQRLDIKSMEPQPIPRFFASLSTSVGEYNVSVRQMIGSSFAQNLYNNRAYDAEFHSLDQLFISLQALSPSPQAIKKLKAFDVKARATDSSGKQLVGMESTKVVKLEQGICQIIQFPIPSKSANSLTLEGDLLLNEDGEERRLHYRLERVPLPKERHIFGTVSLATLTKEQASRIPVIPDTQRIPFATGEVAESLASLFPPHTPEPSPLKLPWRILLQSDLESQFDIFMPQKESDGDSLPVHCTIVPKLLSDGEITGEITFQRGKSPVTRHSFQVWEDEPQVMLLPRSLWENPEKPLAMRVHLFLDFQNNGFGEETSIPVAPFPTSGAVRGATLEGILTVGEIPLGRTLIVLEIMPLGENGQSQNLSRRVRLTTNRQGRWTLANFAAGTYRIRVTALNPQRSELLPNRDLNGYFSHRYGIPKFDIENASQTNVVLRPGSRVTLRPWRIVATNGEGFMSEIPPGIKNKTFANQFLKSSSAMMSNRFASPQDQRELRR